jgi:hypothetical protein
MGSASDRREPIRRYVCGMDVAMRWLLVLSGAVVFAGCVSMAHSYNPPEAPEYAGARQLYIAKCARCHRLYDPTPYSDAEWRMWLTKMSRKAKLTPAQEQELTQYIENVIRKPQSKF